jgi:hypothetical protein
VIITSLIVAVDKVAVIIALLAGFSAIEVVPDRACQLQIL